MSIAAPRPSAEFRFLPTAAQPTEYNLLAGFVMDAKAGGLPEKLGVLEQQARLRQDPARFDRIANLALAIMRNTQDPETIEVANSIANAATLIQANPELREAYEPVLLRCIERLRASMRG